MSEIKMLNTQIPMKNDVFIAMAFILSQLSKDAETKHGCLIINDENHIVGGGYNSFPVGCPDHLLPKTRPEKYPYMIHSEANGLSFCSIRPKGCTIYVTGQPCIECIKKMWQEGIKCVKYCSRMSPLTQSEDEKVRQQLIEMSSINFVEFLPNLDFMVGLVKQLNKLGFISNQAIQNIGM